MRNGSLLFPKLWGVFCFLWAVICVICSRSIIQIEKYSSKGGKMCVIPFSLKTKLLIWLPYSRTRLIKSSHQLVPLLCRNTIAETAGCELLHFDSPSAALLTAVLCGSILKWAHSPCTLKCFFLHICHLVEHSSPRSSLPFYITISLSLVLVCMILVCNIKRFLTREIRNIATECLVTLDSVAD